MRTFDRIRNRITSIRGPHSGYSSTSPGMGNGVSSSSSPRPPNGYERPSLPPPGQRAPISSLTPPTFKASPFYKIEEHLTRVTELPDMPSHRHTVSIQVTLSDHICERLRADTNLRIMLYCTAPSPIGRYELSEISFPNSIEVRMNQEAVPSNYRGLKNKPGTTKPADLTNFVRKQGRYPNVLNINYAQTQKRFSVIVSLVQKVPAETLLAKVKNGHMISKDKVLRESKLHELVKLNKRIHADVAAVRAKAQDADIVATSSVMSLKDPVSTMRMELPCRSTICMHNQCFDALCFIQLQEQAPTWTCPVCSKAISFEGLAVDHYVLDILNSTDTSVEQVVVEPDGAWKEVKPDNDDSGDKSRTGASYDDDSDMDIVEISDGRSGVPLNRSSGPPVTPGVGQHMTPPLSSREQSVSQQTSRGKRPSAVIDLTLSDDDDDDDDEPPRPAKRVSVAGSYSTPASIPDRNMEPPQRKPQTLYSGFMQYQSPQPSHATSPAEGSASMGHSGQQRPGLPWPANYSGSNVNPWNGPNGAQYSPRP